MVYIEKIIEKGYVYFVVGKFDSGSNHHYAKRKKLFWKLLATLQLLKKLKVQSQAGAVGGARACPGGTSSAR